LSSNTHPIFHESKYNKKVNTMSEATGTHSTQGASEAYLRQLTTDADPHFIALEQAMFSGEYPDRSIIKGLEDVMAKYHNKVYGPSEGVKDLAHAVSLMCRGAPGGAGEGLFPTIVTGEQRSTANGVVWNPSCIRGQEEYRLRRKADAEIPRPALGPSSNSTRPE
jgi:hypothetical protein